MDELKNCSKCGNVSLKNNFNKRSASKSNLHPHCKLCCENFYIENRDKSKKVVFRKSSSIN